MKFARLGPLGQEIPVVLEGDEALDICSVTVDIDATFWESDGVAPVRAGLDAGR